MSFAAGLIRFLQQPFSFQQMRLRLDDVSKLYAATSVAKSPAQASFSSCLSQFRVVEKLAHAHSYE
jgi:hypothetical protein